MRYKYGKEASNSQLDDDLSGRFLFLAGYWVSESSLAADTVL